MDIGFKTLPIELILSCILPKLPAKSLLRFKSVSKSFLTEISSPEFTELFSEANHRLLIFPGDEYPTFGIYELDSPDSPPTRFPYPIPSKWYAPSIAVVACCESYLLIGCGFTQLAKLILLNPTTRNYQIIPRVHVPANSNYVEYGICHCSDDIKIVRFVLFDYPDIPSTLREIIVYSLRTNSWKVIESETVTTESIVNPVLGQNHLLVMLCFGGNRMASMTRFGCFDIKAERWSNDVPLSDILLGEIGSNPTRDGHYYLGVLDGRLRFSCYNRDKSTYNIWVMKDYGVKKSWFKLMSLPEPKGVYYPIAYRKGSSHELLCIPNKSGEYVWYNLRDKQFSETGFDGEGLDSNYYSFAYICKASLLNFPGGQPIRSSSKEQEEDNDEEEEDEEEYDQYDFVALY